MSLNGSGEPKIQTSRLEHHLEELGRIGLNAGGGLDRTAFSPAELAARTWLIAKLKDLELDVSMDEAANIWAVRKGRNEASEWNKENNESEGNKENAERRHNEKNERNGNLPLVVFGSHIDTVPNGGKYDGALGVLLALEVLAVLHEQGIWTRHPLALVSFSAEEPNPFGLSTFGSRSVAGKLGRSDLEAAQTGGGMRLAEALRAAGGNPERYELSRRKPGDFSAYLEVHIEQGKRLLSRGIPVGIVTGITGIYREKVTVTGEANHAGTTLMSDRADALAAAAEMLLAFERICRERTEEETVGTVGTIRIEPGAANIIPGKAEFHLEVRGRLAAHIAEVLQLWGEQAERIARQRGVTLKRTLLLDQLPVAMDPFIVAASSRIAGLLDVPTCELGSMAGHDAAHMASLTRSGMLFVPSLEGKSHCPEESSRIEDIEQAGNVLLHTILALDRQLDAKEG